MKQKKRTKAIGGVVFVGCMFLGIGIEIINDANQIGALIGTGVGFIAMGIILKFDNKP